MRRDKKRATAHQAGFVLVMTLLFLGLVSAGAVALMLESRASATGVAGVTDAARARRAVQAGMARAAYGLLVGHDPLKAAGAVEEQPVVWLFDGFDVAISTTAESDRIDLNAGRPELVVGALARAKLRPALRTGLHSAFTDARINGSKFPSVAALLRPCLRRSRELKELDSAFTVATRATGVAPVRGDDEILELIPSLTARDRELIDLARADGRSSSDDRRLRHLRPYLSERSSLYRIVADLLGDGIAQGGRRAIVSISLRWPHLKVASSRDLDLVAASPCPDSNLSFNQ